MTAVQGDIFFNDRKPLDYNMAPIKTPEFVTVVTVDPIEPKSKQPFVTILSIGANDDGWTGDGEEVLVYRLPGERLGFGLKFDGGSNANEKVTKLMIQSCAPDSPASRTVVSWGHFSPGDEILQIDDVPVTEMTRMECVRSLKESNVQLKLRVKKGDINNIRGSGNTSSKQQPKNIPPPVPPRKYPRRGSKPVCPRSTNGPSDGFDKEKEREKFNVPEPQTYTDLIAQETASLGNHESESDDTGSSMSTVVDKQFSTPTTSNSSFSDIRSINSAEITVPPSPDDFSKRKFDLDKVLEPFLQLEREFSSSVTIEDNNDLFEKLVAAAILKETNDGTQVMLEPPDNFQDQCYQTKNALEMENAAPPEEPPKPLPRKEIPKTVTKYGKKRPPPPPPQANEKSNRCPTPNREDHHESSDSDISVDRLPRLIDFVPKDRVDLVIPSAVHPNPVDVLLEHQRILAIVHPETTDHEGSHASVNEMQCNVQQTNRLPRSDQNQPIEIAHRTDTR